jgi:hypothetical protein
MNNVDYWVRMKGIAFFLEPILNLLKDQMGKSVAAMSDEDRSAFENRCMEWLQFFKGDENASQKIARTVRRYQNAIMAIPMPQDHTFTRCRCDEKGEILIQAFVDSAVFEVKVLESICPYWVPKSLTVAEALH